MPKLNTVDTAKRAAVIEHLVTAGWQPKNVAEALNIHAKTVSRSRLQVAAWAQRATEQSGFSAKEQNK